MKIYFYFYRSNNFIHFFFCTKTELSSPNIWTNVTVELDFSSVFLFIFIQIFLLVETNRFYVSSRQSMGIEFSRSAHMFTPFLMRFFLKKWVILGITIKKRRKRRRKKNIVLGIYIWVFILFSFYSFLSFSKFLFYFHQKMPFKMVKIALAFDNLIPTIFFLSVFPSFLFYRCTQWHFDKWILIILVFIISTLIKTISNNENSEWKKWNAMFI